MTTKPEAQAREACHLAIECARAAYLAVKDVVTPPDETGDVQVQPADGESVRRLASRTAEVMRDATAFTPYEVTSDADAAGDPQIKLDTQANDAIVKIGGYVGALVYGEDDLLRKQYGDLAPIYRAEAIRFAVGRGITTVVCDPLDGSHQCAGMYQPGAFGPAVMTLHRRPSDVTGVNTAITVGLGTGEAVASNGIDVLRVSLAAPFPYGHDDFKIDPEWGKSIASTRHYKNTWVLPTYKIERAQEAVNVMMHAQRLPPALRPELIAPLGGNPGILSSMLLAPAGASAAFQPRSWAWDQYIFFIIAALELPVMTLREGDLLDPTALSARFVADLASGTKSDPLVTGLTLEDAHALRDALIATGAVARDQAEEAQEAEEAQKAQEAQEAQKAQEAQHPGPSLDRP